VLKDQVQGQ